MTRTYPNLWKKFCTLENVYLAYEKARKGKTQSVAIRAFEKHERRNLVVLFRELRTGVYAPQPLKRFVLRDPKTRVISVSAFRDRIVHHMLINVLKPIFEPQFICDSYANRVGKGTSAAVERARKFIRAVSKNSKRALLKYPKSVRGYCLKCDIEKYVDTVDHRILLVMVSEQVPDKRLLSLVKIVLKNHSGRVQGKGMPLGNWTSQFFANLYLNELDQYVKHELHVKYYIRYVDDFIIFAVDSHHLGLLKQSINTFLDERLSLSLHPSKCRIIPLHRGVPFLGFRLYSRHVLIQKRNLRRLRARTAAHIEAFNAGIVTKDDVKASFEGWSAYASSANTHKFRLRFQQLLTELCSI